MQTKRIVKPDKLCDSHPCCHSNGYNSEWYCEHFLLSVLRKYPYRITYCGLPSPFPASYWSVWACPALPLAVRVSTWCWSILATWYSTHRVRRKPIEEEVGSHVGCHVTRVIPQVGCHVGCHVTTLYTTHKGNYHHVLLGWWVTWGGRKSREAWRKEDVS